MVVTGADTTFVGVVFELTEFVVRSIDVCIVRTGAPVVITFIGLLFNAMLLPGAIGAVKRTFSTHLRA